ncbi:MAG: DUF2130 domain-containing protein [Chitinophagaceae bacterium]|nr:DUF2130 domain-containing protein [Chitinophagaceae bacterium]
MATDIKCPRCGTQFAIEDAVSEEYKLKLEQEKKELRDQMLAYVKQKDDDYKKRENEIFKSFEQEKLKLEELLKENITRRLASDFENQLKLLKEQNRDNEEKLKLSRQKELEYLQKEQELKNKEAELEISVQKRLQEERTKLSDEIRKLEEQKVAAKETEYQMRLKELEKQLDDQKKLAEEMKRKAEQGSMQLQGEVQELALEDLLRSAFPFDVISEVGKGVKGADCIQHVRNQFGQECGKIIYESKRTKDFSQDWIEKLKTDMRSQGADVAVIVTQAMPKDMDKFGQKDGIWICSFAEVKAVVTILREGIIKIYNSLKSQDNKGDKMQLLYDYLTSNEFTGQWKAVREGFMAMKLSIQKERDAMEKIWKAREKQLEKVLLNAAHIQGSIEGIAGQDSIDLNLLEDGLEDTLQGG